MSDWFVTYKAAGHRSSVLWAVIEGVPAAAKRADVLDALGVWPRWPQWQARQAPGSTLSVHKRTSKPPAELDLSGEFDAITWDQLAPAEKRVSITITGVQYAAMSRRAQAAGQSIRGHVIGLIDADIERGIGE